jgi:hypothetical protein
MSQIDPQQNPEPSEDDSPLVAPTPPQGENPGIVEGYPRPEDEPGDSPLVAPTPPQGE